MIYYCQNFVFIYINAICIFRFIIMNKKISKLKKKDSLTPCRDNDRDTAAIISYAVLEVIDSMKPKKHLRLPNKQTAEFKTF